MVNAKKRRNSTYVDEKGLKYGLVRSRNESLNSFQKRIDKAVSNISNHFNKFHRSLGYCTELQDINVFEITKTNSDEKVVIDITDTRFYIYVDDVVVYKQLLRNVKFLKDLKAELDLVSSIQVSVITDIEWEYLRTENLMQTSSLRSELNYIADEYVSALPEKDVVSVQDTIGILERSVDSEDVVIDETTYHLDGNILFRGTDENQQLMIEYLDFPLIVRWSPIRAYSLNDQYVSDLLKDRIKDNETFGVIPENHVDLSGEVVEILSQKGAKIINKILEKHNTYWGE